MEQVYKDFYNCKESIENPENCNFCNNQKACKAVLNDKKAKEIYLSEVLKGCEKWKQQNRLTKWDTID